MATSRGPLLARPPPHQSPSHHSRIHKSTSSLTKRPRSPEPAASGRTKRAKAPSHTPTPIRSSVARDERRADHEGRRVEKEAVKGAREEEFRIKYRNAFPSWVFYFDADVPGGPALENARADIEALGARVDSFFSAEVTHLITNQAVPSTPVQSASTSTMDNKENTSKLRNVMTRTASHLKSPLNGKSRHADDDHSVLAKAQQFGIKIWHLAKLGSVIERCVLPEERLELPAGPSRGASQKGSLTSLLAAERLHGVSDRDSTQRRQDYHYFSKNSYFVLVEDIRGELATIAAAEFAITKEADGEERGAWPVLHCHPRARGPFIPFDEKEERRWEKQENALKQRQVEKDRAKARFLRRKRRQEEWQAMQAVEARKQGGGDLRRTVSLNNLRRGESLPDTTVGDLDTTGLFDSAYASGFLASGTNVAASGNSVAITSTTGTTSTVGSLNGRPLPPNLRGKVLNEVPLRRRSQLAEADAPDTAQSGVMGPPAAIPPRLDGRKGLLRKAKSTNTIRLPKRNEGAKPGFCESCRTKFEDFTKHIGGKRHRNFATNPNNFTQLDLALSHVRRRTTAEVATENARYASGDGLFSDVDHEVPLHFGSTDSDAFGPATLL